MVAHRTFCKEPKKTSAALQKYPSKELKAFIRNRDSRKFAEKKIESVQNFTLHCCLYFTINIVSINYIVTGHTTIHQQCRNIYSPEAAHLLLYESTISVSRRSFILKVNGKRYVFNISTLKKCYWVFLDAVTNQFLGYKSNKKIDQSKKTARFRV